MALRKWKVLRGRFGVYNSITKCKRQRQWHSKKVIDKINSAFLKIEIADKKHHVVNIAQINAELIRRSKLEYFEATQNSDIGALQDSVGYFEAAYQFFTKHKSLYKAANSDKTDDLSDYLEQLAPFFKNFQAFDEKANHKKLAGIAAKLELGLANLQ